MLGPAKARHLDQPIAVSLEDLVPKSNFYRLLEAKLDLSFVCEWVQEHYADRGRPSIDPVIFFKLQLIMFFEGIRSKCQLIAAVRAILNRQVWVEPLFAEAKEWHGVRRLRLRGLVTANIQGLLIAAGQNQKRLLAATGWGRRHAPCESMLALPTEAHGLSAVAW